MQIRKITLGATEYFVLFETGKFCDPIAILTEMQARALCDQMLNELSDRD